MMKIYGKKGGKNEERRKERNFVHINYKRNWMTRDRLIKRLKSLIDIQTDNCCVPAS